MPNLFALLIVVIPTAALLLGPLWLVVRYVREMEDAVSQSESSPRRKEQPTVAILLCLRGRDPYLIECLTALLNQDYPDYQLICIVDHGSDPALQIVRQFDDDPRLSVVVVSMRRKSCSLKCNSLIEGFESIGEDREVVVLVDADTVVDRRWLHDLVQPLSDPTVAAVSGNRWFIPSAGERGSLVRHLWNLGAAPQMHFYRIPWGGSLAMSTRFVRECGVLDLWRRALFEDTMIARLAADNRQTVVIAPGVLISNQESISLSAASQWIKRQLLDTRLYHASFPLVAIHSFGVAGLLAGLIIAGLVWTAVLGDVRVGALCAACLLAYGLFYWWAWWRLESVAQLVLQRCRVGESIKQPSIWQFPIGHALVTQCVYTWATLKALMTRRVQWRGIEYRIRKPYSIEMVRYRPMIEVQREQGLEPGHSL